LGERSLSQIVPRRVPIVLLSTALESFLSVRRAAALALTELGVALFFVIGVAGARIGAWALIAILVACLLAMWARAIDIESWALLVPGGLPGRAERAFGARVARGVTAVALVERLLLTALACLVAAHYVGSLGPTIRAAHVLVARATADELSAALAVALLGIVWLRARLGRRLASGTVAQGVWIGVGIVTTLTVWSAVTVAHLGWPAILPALDLPMPVVTDLPSAVNAGLGAFVALGLVIPAIGGGEALTRLAHEFAPPRVGALRRTSRAVVLVASLGTALLAIAFAVLVPPAERALWTSEPLSGVAYYLWAPAWVNHLLTIAVAGAAVAIVAPAIRSALDDAEHDLRRLAAEGVLPEELTVRRSRLGGVAKSVDTAAAAVALTLVASGGRVSWLAGAYGLAVAATLVVRTVVLARLRRTMPGPRPFTAPGTIDVHGAPWPVGLMALGGLMGVTILAMLVSGEAAWIAAAALVAVLVGLVVRRAGGDEAAVGRDMGADLQILAASPVAIKEADARPGGLLVAVRHAHALEHVAAALQSAGDRDIVVMTVRLPGGDGSGGDAMTPSPVEQALFAEVIAIVERYGRPARLLIVPAPTVADGIVAATTRLRSSAVYVGESATLSADEQARLMGEAWERAPNRPEGLDVRLVIQHRSGRTDTYQIGAHTPSLSPADLDLIHRVWRDAVAAIGPHVHHHDVVRAALTQMEHQLNGPGREEALALIRETARPAEELAALVRGRDFTRLRDVVRNRPPSDVAEVLTALGLEDQVVVFRVLPRKDAAAVFEYLSREAQESLLKAMAQEDVARLLNDMAPDDRTMFLEELPAAATRQLLTLLTPEERAVAVSLLGYPEDSIGRLMTPHYVAVREQWTIGEVLDYVRTHGRDSETLNMLYVVDDHDQLIDDIRIREVLLTAADVRVADLMDRRFVALKATDDQATAVAAFRQHDRTALPVTDTAGMLIGIVTIDDVLDVAEAAATREIQRIGGSEALDEPYMRISFVKMIQKRAGWLTALFLGEMLTATAMNFFQAEIAKAVVLALFVPLIISSGGNSGSQASTLVIRALALGEVGLADWWRVMRREILAGLALGGILGSIGFLRITLWSGFSDIYGEHWLLLAMTVALALLGIVLWGTLIGSLLPFLLRRLGFDPATSSAPFVATLVDVTGLVIYFSVAMVILRGTLL
jgi:magnesium transporter